MKDLIIALFGEYEPLMTTEYVVHMDYNAIEVVEPYEVVASGIASLDWSWIAGVVLFAIVLYCFFRLVGVLLK